MTRRKRKTVRRRNNSPTVRLDIAGSFAAAEWLHTLEDQNGDQGRESRGKEGAVAVLSAANEYKDTERIPEPAIAQSAHKQHEDSYTSGGAPALQATHQA